MSYKLNNKEFCNVLSRFSQKRGIDQLLIKKRQTILFAGLREFEMSKFGLVCATTICIHLNLSMDLVSIFSLCLFCLCCFVFILSATLRYFSLNRSPLVKQSLHEKLSILSFITSTMVMCLCRQKTHCILNQFVPIRYTRLL